MPEPWTEKHALRNIRPLRGHLKHIVGLGALGVDTAITYDNQHRIASEVCIDPATGGRAGLDCYLVK